MPWEKDGPCGHGQGLATFMAAAGVTCSQRLGDLVAGLEPAGRPRRSDSPGRLTASDVFDGRLSAGRK